MSEPDSNSPASAPTKRPRPVISCLECRRKKLKCSRTHPCQQCVKIGKPSRCEYQAGQEPEPNVDYSASYNAPNKRPRLLLPPDYNEDEASLERIDTRRQGPVAAKSGVLEDLQERVARLESALLAQNAQMNREPAPYSHSTGPPDSRSSADETRHLGRSIHISSKFSGACAFLSRLQHDSSTTQILQLRADLTELHSSVESNHREQRSQATSASSNTRHTLQLPPFEICQKLAVLYFDNMEHCFRILLWSEFRDQLDLLFSEGETACRFGFIPQLVGALAIAVLLGTHQECEAAAAYRTISATEAIHFMEEFLGGLHHDDRYRLPALQVKMLVLICRWLNLEPFDNLFRLNGELLRDALVMKMDQDPTVLDNVSIFEGELRRRNWMTIIEVDLMLSILCQLPCLVPPYTSQPPRNVNDDEIFERMLVLPASRPTTEWTDGLCQYLLAQTFPRRVSACAQLDKLSRVTAEDILPHIRYLEQVLQELPAPLRFNYLGDEASKTPARLMARMELDISIRRPLMHLYSRGVLSPDLEDVPRDIRAGYLQSCLMIANYQDLFDPQYSELDVPRPHGYWDFFYSCYRQELGQATLGLCVEIKNLSSTIHANGNGSTNPASSSSSSDIPANTVVKASPYTRESLINAVKDTLEPMRRRLPHRASKVKDIVYYETILTSLLPETAGQAKEVVITERLHSLVRECRVELERAAVTNASASAHDAGHDIPDGNISSFDPLWEGFPKIDIFEPLDFAPASADSRP
ncbi:hypothetical protein G647_02614 [Cladophialophora carrionii CBS 160.54]|uniref:Zn(2)-C6 fungal-type domain-containing protein n=1 Tax=Cladophialophora carrionii CBS 160.54 TaxID=1279043 RepID=V9DIR6_9EURO|nr:uncharacterized protein G647_02614 [Cladophialophora carrionii CBS 160.54]ETI25837.1 hypothetical protein G647_02614 [Cladophialophora carrionii CBS 160.54]